MSSQRKIYRGLEFFTLFFVVPFLYYFGLFRVPVLVFLWALTVPAVIYLWKHPEVRLRDLLSFNVSRESFKKVLVRFLILSGSLTLIVYFAFPQYFLEFPKNKPWLWLVVLAFYPLFSVIPQAIIYRIFYVVRYRKLFANTSVLILCSAISFSYMHLIFDNWIAIVLTFIGGLLFMRTYHESKSFALSVLEHAMYGCFIFTIGLGRFIYHG